MQQLLIVNSGCPYLLLSLDKPINNAFVRNFQLIQFIDLGTAWNGAYDKIGRPYITYQNPLDPTVSVNLKGTRYRSFPWRIRFWCAQHTSWDTF